MSARKMNGRCGGVVRNKRASTTSIAAACAADAMAIQLAAVSTRAASKARVGVRSDRSWPATRPTRDVLRPDGRQGVPAPHVLQTSKRSRPHVMTASHSIEGSAQRAVHAAPGFTALILGQRLGEWCGRASARRRHRAEHRSISSASRARCSRACRSAGRAFTKTNSRSCAKSATTATSALPSSAQRRHRAAQPDAFHLVPLIWERCGSSEASLRHRRQGVKEARYHQQHSPTGWCAWATAPPNPRRAERPADCGRYGRTVRPTAVDSSGARPGPAWAPRAWLAEMQALFDEAKLQMPTDTAFRSTGKRGVHSEHMGFLLSDMQYLQRAYPGGAW